MNKRDRDDFAGYLRNCTDRQVQGCYEREVAAHRRDYAQLCLDEACRRGIYLEEP